MKYAIVDLTVSAATLPDLTEGYDGWIVAYDPDQARELPPEASETFTWISGPRARDLELVSIWRPDGREALYGCASELHAAAKRPPLKPDAWLLWVLSAAGFRPVADQIVDLTDSRVHTIPMHALNGLFPLEGCAA